MLVWLFSATKMCFTLNITKIKNFTTCCQRRKTFRRNIVRSVLHKILRFPAWKDVRALLKSQHSRSLIPGKLPYTKRISNSDCEHICVFSSCWSTRSAFSKIFVEKNARRCKRGERRRGKELRISGLSHSFDHQYILLEQGFLSEN